MIVSILGLGYIGLPTAAIVASKNIKVLGVDINKDIVDLINEGRTHISEPELEGLVKNSVNSKQLVVSTKIQKADVFIIAVPTPFKKDNKPDLSFVKSACEEISTVLKKGDLVILESTCPVGATEKVREWLQNKRKDLTFPDIKNSNIQHDISIAHSPERVLPGNVIEELVKNDRIIGGLTPKCSEKALSFYKIFVEGDCVVTDSRTAELCKLVENSFRDLNIAFANEVSLICDNLEINVWDLINLANKHPRVEILNPGPGVGGHCLAVDPWFIVDTSPEHSKLIKTARQVNDSKPEFILKKLKGAVSTLQKEYSELKISIFGLAFKPNVSDLRESPALKIALEIKEMGFDKLLLVEPNLTELPQVLNSDQTFLVNSEFALSEADIVLILVGHESFKGIKLEALKNKQIIDSIGLINFLT